MKYIENRKAFNLYRLGAFCVRRVNRKSKGRLNIVIAASSVIYYILDKCKIMFKLDDIKLGDDND